jgi:hypothetical protein
VKLLNPSAGDHAIPDDPDELAASVWAGELFWREWPYYAWRYGERGRQFAWSDSAWLATLAPLGPDLAWREVTWLGRLLAARGMPQLLLERHLVLLGDVLVAARPERAERYQTLTGVADRMGAARTEALGDTAVAALREEFDRDVGPEWSGRLPRTGELLAAAVADERLGIDGAVTSLESWLTDAGRFPARWIEAVRRTVAGARAWPAA